MPAKILEGQNPVRRELAKEETSAVEGAGGAWRKNAASSMGIPLHTVMTDDRSKNLFQFYLLRMKIFGQIWGNRLRRARNTIGHKCPGQDV